MASATDSDPKRLGARFSVGEEIAGKYQVVAQIGAGGIGFVLSAHHRGFDAPVALKFLHPEFARVPAVLSAFVREAQTGFQIESDHVVRVLDVDALPDGTPFIAMELLHGIDLRRLVEREGRLPLSLVLDYVRQTCAGLTSAHAQGVVHCDIKPENLYLSQNFGAARWPAGCIKILDFGISNAAWTESPRRRASSLVPTAVGTPRYMSPEQVRGEADLDARSDIWSLGCVMYELLSGIPAFDRPSISQICAAVLEEEPIALATHCPRVPEALLDIVQRCLHKDRAQRYASAEALADAVGTVLDEPHALPATPEKPARTLRAPRHGWLVAIGIALGIWAGTRAASTTVPRMRHPPREQEPSALETPLTIEPEPEPEPEPDSRARITARPRRLRLHPSAKPPPIANAASLEPDVGF